MYNSHFGPKVQNVANMRVILKFATSFLAKILAFYPHYRHFKQSESHFLYIDTSMMMRVNKWYQNQVN